MTIDNVYKEANFIVSYLISRSHFQYFTIAMRMRINSKDFVVGIFNRCILYDTKGSIFYGYGRKQLYC